MYNTSGIRDFTYTSPYNERVTLSYEGKLLIDSGLCTGGQRRVRASYYGHSRELRLDVEPNCFGPSGTRWEIGPLCADPYPCPPPKPNSAACELCHLNKNGGTSRIHDYICCNNCDQPNPTCDGRTYQGGSDGDYCGKCGEDISGGKQYYRYILFSLDPNSLAICVTLKQTFYI